MEWILMPWVIASTILLFVAGYWIYTLEHRLKVLETRYRRILSLAEEADQVTIAHLLAALEAQAQQLEQVEKELAHLAVTRPYAVQGYGLVRYNAFPDMGGEQSFSLALVDAEGGGVILTSLHGRGETRLYAKALTAWQSPYTLSTEEQQALAAARRCVDGPSDEAIPDDEV